MTNDYTKQGNDFLASTNTTLTWSYDGHQVPPFNPNGAKVAAWTWTLTRPGKDPITGPFFASVMASYNINDIHEYTTYYRLRGRPLKQKDLRLKGFDTATKRGGGEMQPGVDLLPVSNEPTAYDLLTCLDVFDGTFSDFCTDFGYDTDSRRALEIYLNTQKQTDDLRRFFSTDELEKLAEIV